jgi:chromosomal replication initiator protein DnaA
MGLFDRLFRKKKSSRFRPPRGRNAQTVQSTGYDTSASLPTAEAGGLPVKGPPGQAGDASVQQTQRGRAVQTMEPSGLSDTDIQREIEASVQRITKTVRDRRRPVPSGQTRKVVRPKSSVAPVRTPVQRPAERRTSGTGSAAAASRMTREQLMAAESKQLNEDTMGEEELFKKLAQWDKDLKRKPASKKTAAQPGVKSGTARVMTPTAPGGSAAGAGVGAVSTPTPPTKAGIPKKSMSEEQMAKQTVKLRRYEAKLRDREKRLTKREEMNQAFTAIEDTELEGFSKELTLPPEGIPVDITDREVELQRREEELARREAELQKASALPAEMELSEELYQPLKNLVFSNFIVGPSNRFAHDVALAVGKTPADAYNPLFIYSEVGLGKTHLLCAIGNYIKSKNPNVKTVYASSEKFTNELLDYLRLGEMEKFRSKYRNIDVLLIDDIQFIGGQEGTQEEFFHTFNSLYNDHKQIVITSDRPPKNIAHLKDRLRSRFEGGLIVNIKPPDLGTRTRILHEKAERDGIYISEEIINYIAGKVKSNVRSLIGILNRVVAHSSLTDRDLDTELVDEVLHDVMDEKMQLPID